LAVKTHVGPRSCVLYTGHPYMLVSTLSAFTWAGGAGRGERRCRPT
jgi:hypothetical protein